MARMRGENSPEPIECKPLVAPTRSRLYRRLTIGGPLAVPGFEILSIALLCAVTLCQASAAPSPTDFAALRQAINDIMATSAANYPAGEKFLKQLDALENSSQTTHAANDNLQNDFCKLQRKALLANPLVTRAPILFVVRQQYRPDHHNTATFFPNTEHEYNDGAFTPGGALKVIDLAHGGEVRTLLENTNGVVRDPEIHFKGRKIVFSYRTNPLDSYHIYEIYTDSLSLRQLTFARDIDDLDPLYLPDDRIAFSSTRELKYCMCNRHIMANLYRMDSDGANIHQIGKSTLFEGHGSLMPDGRILYDRWEYVDRNFGDAQSLWSVNPDGSNHALYWGNNTASPGAVLDGRIIPGTDLVVCTFSSCHDRPWGAIAIVDRSLGLDGKEPVRHIWPAESMKLIQAKGWQLFDAFAGLKIKYEDPYPLSEKYFLCSCMTTPGGPMGIYLIDVFGNEVLVHAEGPGCFDPMPLAPRTRPPIIPTRRDFENREGYFYVEDVYQGTHMAGVKRGDVKFLRVVESPEKRYWTRPAWNGQGQEAPAMKWHDFNNKRILGTVPVAEDGSAYFAVPSDKFVYFQLLDEQGMMIQSMRSGTMVQSGERAGCVGCHAEPRLSPSRMGRAKPPAEPYVTSSAARRDASPSLDRQPDTLQGWYGPPREFSYLRDVQPIFTKHCLECHDFGKKAADKLNLAPDRDLVFNVSYNELWRKKYLAVVGAGPPETQPAYSWGSHASKFIKALQKSSASKSLSKEDWDRLYTWIDLNAPYYPSYACAYPNNLAGRCPLDGKQLARLEQLTGVPLRRQADHSENKGPQVSFDRPELSPCLANLTNHLDHAYLEALQIIRAGQESLITRPEADKDGFNPCEIDLWREKKYRERQNVEMRNRAAIRQGLKIYEGGK